MKFRPVLFVSVFLLAVPLSGCRRPSQAVAPVPVTVAKPERRTLRRTTVQPGHIQAFEEAPLFAKVSGYVEKVESDIGDRVKAGQLLAKLSAPEMEEELSQKEALVAQAKADRVQAEAGVRAAEAAARTSQAKVVEAQAAAKRAEADVDRFRSELSRIQALGRDKVVQEKVVDEAQSQFRSAEAAREESAAKIESARAGLLESEARLAKAQADVGAAVARVAVAEADYRRMRALLDYTKIIAPFDGVVSQRNVHPGHFTGGAGKEPLLVVVRTDPVRIFVNVPERDAVLVDPGARAVVRIEALGNREFQGTVARSSWALDSIARTLRAEIDIPNPEGKLRPGMYASAVIVLEEHPGALTVPASAVVKQGGPFSYVVSGGKAVRKPITLGLEEGGRVEVSSGLTGDEDVVQANPAALQDDQAVQAAPAPRG
jgi:HlyD family secretion protein